MKGSIIVLCFNKVNFTLAALKDLALLKDFEIIVLNNGSIDETEEKVKSFIEDKPNFKYIKSDINLGFAGGSNKTFEHSSGEHIIFLNNDIRVKDKYDNWADDLIAESDDNTLVSPTGGYVEPKEDFAFKYETEDAAKKINYLSGWCLAGKRSVFEKLIPKTNKYQGPFSEEFGLAYFEDTDLSFRAFRLGINLKLVPIPVSHFGKISSSQLNTNILYTSAKKIFLNKWKNK